jgi:hypothetical protein
MDATDAALMEDWNRYITSLRETDLTAYHLTNNYFRFSERQWRRPFWSLRAIALYIVLFVVATAAVVLIVFSQMI